MKKTIVLLSTVLFLTGCAAIDKVKQVWPRNHDSALVTGYVNLQVSLDSVSCSNKNTIDAAITNADWLNRYAEFRNDPQKISTKAITENLAKAKDGSEAVCQRWVNLSKTRMKIIQEAWSGR